MGFLTILEATIKLGIPMVVLSWIIFTWLYGGGDLDRKADRKSIKSQVKEMKKSFKKKKDGGAANYMVEKWMWFGSGFYGLAGLWTFVVVEIADVLRLIFNPSLILDSFDDGLVSAVISLVVNQFSNLITAFVWFGYWPDDGFIIWILVAYAGYWIGVEMARRGEDLPIQELLRKLRSLLP
ncbi:MAG: hypothetical protein COB20_05465 [SAR86 cluster bacterium]|uniref:Uncharacterized protein n=1 Tax=SAR86 cluster bacterium TaxID=2030880 RepID=A0A2A4X9E3_9GAMM|nr:MAG: hypothetical protein COB20_05465 [SAR86 cluster bacterium]